MRVLPFASVGELEEEKELDESVLLGRRVPGMLGIDGAGVPRMVVPRELFAVVFEAPGCGLAGVPKIVVFCVGVAGVVLGGAGFGAVIIPGAVSVLGGGLRGATAELEAGGGFPVVDCAWAAAVLANASADATAIQLNLLI